MLGIQSSTLYTIKVCRIEHWPPSPWFTPYRVNLKRWVCWIEHEVFVRHLFIYDQWTSHTKEPIIYYASQKLTQHNDFLNMQCINISHFSYFSHFCRTQFLSFPSTIQSLIKISSKFKKEFVSSLVMYARKTINKLRYTIEVCRIERWPPSPWFTP